MTSCVRPSLILQSFDIVKKRQCYQFEFRELTYVRTKHKTSPTSQRSQFVYITKINRLIGYSTIIGIYCEIYETHKYTVL
jgi:hypothetical protein